MTTTIKLPSELPRARPGQWRGMLTQVDEKALAWTIHEEARGEPLLGQIAVAYVIHNRWRTGYRNKTSIEEVVRDPWQFSCWNQHDRFRTCIVRGLFATPAIRTAHLAGLLAFDGWVQDPTFGSRHYHADYIDPPSWADEDKLQAHIGRHKFYAGIA